jgi:2-keto-4-pentenoate hydratase
VLRRRRVQSLVQLLMNARRGEDRITTLPSHLAPQSLAEAYDAASALLAQLGDKIIGYRVGASSPTQLAALHLVEPYAARLAERTLRKSAATISLNPEVSCFVQPHFAFRVSRTLRDGARSREELCSALAELRPALEVLHSPFADPIVAGGWAVIAANGMHAGLVVGEPVARWDDRGLPGVLVQSSLNGALHSSGLGADAFGDPIGMLLWLANDRARAGTPLQAGHLVLSGAIGPAIEVRAGDSVEADFVGLGGVMVHYSAIAA